MSDPTLCSIYRLRVVLNGVSPLVWRRFLVSSKTNLADLHEILQLAFGWSGFYLYEFRIHGRTFGDARSVCLADFQLHPGERFRYRYNCSKGEGTKSFSPLARVLPERSTPERLYLETLFASLLSYGTTTKLLKELLPLEEQLNAMTIRDHLLAVAKRSEAELGTEQVSFIEGCPRDWAMICLRKRGQVLVNYCLDFADAREFQIRVETGSLVSCVVAWDYRRFRYNQRAWLGRGRDFWECDFGSTRF